MPLILQVDISWFFSGLDVDWTRLDSRLQFWVQICSMYLHCGTRAEKAKIRGAYFSWGWRWAFKSPSGKFAMLQLRSGTLKHLLVKASHIVKPKGNSVEIYILSSGRFLQSQDKGCGCLLPLQGRRRVGTSKDEGNGLIERCCEIRLKIVGWEQRCLGKIRIYMYQDIASYFDMSFLIECILWYHIDLDNICQPHTWPAL